MIVSEAYQQEFAEPVGYVNFAAIGPPSRRVQTTVGDAYAGAAEPDGEIGTQMLAGYEAVRRTLGRFLAAAPEQVMVVPSTSWGLFKVAFGLIPDSGNIVVPAHEFPANLYPWLRAAELGGPEVRRVDIPDYRVTAGVLSEAVDDQTRAIVLSAVDYQSGFTVDLAAMRELAGDALLVVDAIQALGAIEMSLAPADVVVAGGQKWLRAGWGCGVLATSPRALDRLHPVLTGWFGVADFFDFAVPAPHAPRADAERFQDGSPPYFGALAMAAAVEIIELAGSGAIEAAIRENVVRAEEAVRKGGAEVFEPWRGDGERAGILCFRLPGEPAATTGHRLAQAGITVSVRGEWVRVSPHASTDPAVFDALTEALGEAPLSS